MKKKLVLLLAVAVAFTLTAVAQESGNTQTSQETTAQTTTKTKKSKKTAAGETAATKKAKEVTEQGCLSAGKEPDTWTLTKGKKSYEVTGMDLSQHVGHEVKLTGTWEKEKPAAGEKKAGKELKVANVEHIADTCTTATAAKAPKAKKSKKAEKTPGL